MSDTAPTAVTLVVGPESLLAERAVAEVLAAARTADPDVERHDVDADGDDAAADLLEALSPTLFGGGALVVLSGFDAADEPVAEILRGLLAQPEPGLWCVAVHPGGMKGKGVLESLRKAGAAEMPAEKVKGRGFEEFITRELRRHRRKATSDAVAALRAAVGDDLRALASACSQLASDVEGDPIDLAAVQQYHEGDAGATSFAISDAVWNANPVAVLVGLRWALDRDPGSGPLVVATVANGLRALMRLAAAPPGMGQNELAREVGVPAWKLRSLRDQLQHWPRASLAEAAVSLARVDAAVKGGQDGEGLDPAQKRVVLERSLLHIARSRRAVAG